MNKLAIDKGYITHIKVWSLSTLILLVLWGTYYFWENEIIYNSAFIISAYWIIFSLAFVLGFIFLLMGLLIKKTGFMESEVVNKFVKMSKISIRTLSYIIAIIVLSILALGALFLFGWFLFSLSATTIIIILLVLILFK